MKISRVGVDLAKRVFQIHAVDAHEKPVLRVALKRDEWLEVLSSKLEPGCVVGLEACSGAHHWARELRSRGFEPKLIAPQFVKPYLKSHKTDRNDAEAICEAISRPSMRFVPMKSIEQQDMQAMHRIRDELIKMRTATVNQVRGLAAEYGVVAPISRLQLRRAIPIWLEDAENRLTMRFRRLLNGLQGDLNRLDDRIDELDKEIAAAAKDDPVAQRLMELRGVGPLIATALAYSLGNGSAFSKGKEYAASLGLTPRQHSSGGKTLMLGISKRGDGYLRRLLILGAKSAIRANASKQDSLGGWIRNMQSRKHTNVVAVALAAKTARAAWALVSKGESYRPEMMAVAR